MAKDIPTIDRTIATPNVPIEPNRVYAQLGEVTSQIGSLLANTFSDVAIQQYGEAGKLDALTGKAPKDLAVPLNKATASYNKAVVDTEFRNLTIQGREMILDAYARYSDPAKFNAKTPQEFNAHVTGVVQGIMESARPEYKAELLASLNDVASRTKIGMLDEAIKYDNKQTVSLFDRERDAAIKNLNEAYATKNPEQIKGGHELLDKIYADYSIINQQIANKIPDYKKIDEADFKTAQIVGDYIEAYSKGVDEVGSFLNNLAVNKPENLTTEEWFNAQSKVLELHKKNRAGLAEIRNLTFQNLGYGIDTGKINTFEQIVAGADNKLTGAEIFQLQGRLAARLAREGQDLAAIQRVQNAMNVGPQEVDKLPGKDLNTYYEYKVAEATDIYNSNVKPEDRVKSISLTQKMQNIVAPMGAPVDNFLTELKYGLKSEDPATALDAINAYRYGWNNQNLFGDTLKGLDSDANQIAQVVLATSDQTEEPTIDAIQRAQKAVFDQTVPTIEARKIRFKEFMDTRGGYSQIQQYYKDAFGVWPTTGMTDASFGQFIKTFEAFFMRGADGDEETARKMTTSMMRNWGESKYAEPGNIINTVPEKSTPFADMGHWLDNQFLFGLNEALKNVEALQLEQQKNGIPIETKIERPDWMKKLPEGNIPEEDIVQNNYYNIAKRRAMGADITTPVGTTEFINAKFQMTAKIKGIERNIYITPTIDTRTTATGNYVFQFYYKDDNGYAHFIPSSVNPEGAQQNLIPMDKYLPRFYQKFTREDLSDLAERYSKSQNEAELHSIYKDVFLGRMPIAGTVMGTERYQALQRKIAEDASVAEQAFIKKQEAGKKDLLKKDAASTIIENQDDGEPPATGGVVPSTGRPIIQNSDGTVSSELTITVTHPELNSNKPTNIPSVWDGKELSPIDAIRKAIDSGMKFESFDTIEKAVKAAVDRSKKLGEEIAKLASPLSAELIKEAEESKNAND